MSSDVADFCCCCCCYLCNFAQKPLQTSFIHRVERYGSRLAPSSPWDPATHGRCSSGSARRSTFGIFTNYRRIFLERNSGGLIPTRRESAPHATFTFHSSLTFVLYIEILRRVDSKMFLAVEYFFFKESLLNLVTWWVVSKTDFFCGGRSPFFLKENILRYHVTCDFENDFCGV